MNLIYRKENIRFINPQLFGNCPVNYILTVHLDNLKNRHANIRPLLVNYLKHKNCGLIANDIENLESTYSREVVYSFIYKTVFGGL